MKQTGNRLGRFGLYLFAVSIPISFVPAQVGIAVAVLGWFLQGLPDRSWQVRRHPFFSFLLFYIGWNLMASLFSERPLASLLAVADNEWAALLMVMMYWLIEDERMLRRIVTLFLTSSTIAVCYGIWQTFGGVELYRGMPLTPINGLYRSVGFQGFYLTFAAFAMSVFFLAVALTLELREKWIRRAVAGVSLVSLLSIIGTFARSIWLGILLVVPLIGLFKGKKTGLGALAGIAVFAIVTLTVSSAVRDRAVSMFDPAQNQTRINLWKTSLEIARDNPVFGVGEDNFTHVFDRYRVEGTYDTFVHPHNDYLNVLVSSGIPGLLAFLGMWVVALKTGRATTLLAEDRFVRGTAMGATLGLVGFLIGSIFQNYYGTFANCLGWWFLVGLIFACARLAGTDQVIARKTASS